MYRTPAVKNSQTNRLMYLSNLQDPPCAPANLFNSEVAAASESGLAIMYINSALTGKFLPRKYSKWINNQSKEFK